MANLHAGGESGQFRRTGAINLEVATDGREAL